MFCWWLNMRIVMPCLKSYNICQNFAIFLSEFFLVPVNRMTRIQHVPVHGKHIFTLYCMDGILKIQEVFFLFFFTRFGFYYYYFSFWAFSDVLSEAIQYSPDFCDILVCKCCLNFFVDPGMVKPPRHQARVRVLKKNTRGIVLHGWHTENTRRVFHMNRFYMTFFPFYVLEV